MANGLQEKQGAAGFEPHQAERPWLRALRDPDPRLRARAAQVLGELGGRLVERELHQALHDGDPEVRQAVVLALRHLERQTH